MKHKMILGLLVAVVFVFLALGLGSTRAAPVPRADTQAGGYDLTWTTLDGGGGSSSGGGYSLSGAIGQPDAGTLSGGGYTLNGGYWGGASINYNLYLPLVLKG